MQPGPGTMVTPHVRLVRELGRGGMGSVWVADHLTLNAQVAVKLISTGMSGPRDQLLARFQREASSAARISNPHVVRIFDQGFGSDGTPYIVMELLVGETLAARLERVGRLQIPEVGVVLRQVGSALGAAHELGIIHRDIKPENVFLVDSDAGLFVKVLDFGIAKEEQATMALTATGAVFGTPTYMSPEQLDSAKDVDERADLWALGVVAYTAITGHPPFDGDSLLELSLAIMKGTFTPASQRVAAIPPALDAWFDRALARDLDQRFTSCREMLDAFQAAAGSTVDMRASQRELRDAAAARAPATPKHVQTVALAPSLPPTPASPTRPMLAAPAHAPAPAHPVRTPRILIALAAIILAGAAGAVAFLVHGTDEPSSPPSDRVSADDDAMTKPSSSPPASPTTAASAAGDGTGLIAIGAGRYWVGCRTDRNRECFDDEKPAHEVHLSRFSIMAHEVTVAEYAACASAGQCPEAGRDRGCLAKQAGAERLPINCVDWHAARAYCRSQGQRLPTEAEWEAAALGPEHRDFPWGSDPPSCERTRMGECDETGPSPVGTHASDRSWAGAMDMAGNLREWTASDYAAYPGGSVDAASHGKVNRGGSFEMGPEQFDTTHTRRVDEASLSRSDLGFRCVVD